MRLIWGAGGGWERFFLLCPVWWGAYIVALLVLSSPQSPDAFLRLLVVGFSFVGLLDAWWAPIFSSAVLRATLGTGLNRNDETARLFADYLDSLGRGGRWPSGNILGLVYLGVMFGWGFVATNFPLLTGVENAFAFYPVYLAALVVLWSVDEVLLRRLLREAQRAGYPIELPRRISG